MSCLGRLNGVRRKEVKALQGSWETILLSQLQLLLFMQPLKLKHSHNFPFLLILQM